MEKTLETPLGLLHIRKEERRVQKDKKHVFPIVTEPMLLLRAYSQSV